MTAHGACLSLNTSCWMNTPVAWRACAPVVPLSARDLRQAFSFFPDEWKQYGDQDRAWAGRQVTGALRRRSGTRT